jgi:hypothetical protein
VLSDPNNQQCTYEEALLMQAARAVSTALEPLTPEEADFMVRHYDVIATTITYGSLGAGAGLTMFAKNLDDVSVILRDIEALHTQTFQKDGRLSSQAFFNERKRLLARLDIQLTTLTKKGISFPDHPNLKTALGIATPNLVHRWRKAGAAGQIPGYATHIEGVAKAAKYIKYGGWIGTAVGGSASVIKVQGVCAEGNAEACEKVKFTEAGSFIGGIAVGAGVGAALTSTTVGAICVAVGVPTGGIGTLLCGVMVVGVGAFAGGAVGSSFGGAFADLIYEQRR